MFTWTWYGSLSSSISKSPLRTTLLSSTKTLATCPLMRGATYVTSPLTYASSVETVFIISRTQGTPTTHAATAASNPTIQSHLRLRTCCTAALFVADSVCFCEAGAPLPAGVVSLAVGSDLVNVLTICVCPVSCFGLLSSTTVRAYLSTLKPAPAGDA